MPPETRPRRAITTAMTDAPERATPKARAARAKKAPPPLLEVGGRPPLGVYLHRLLDRRHFAWAQARAQTTTKNSSNLLGNLWLILNPIFDAMAFYFIFAIILKTDRGMPNFFAFLVLGIFLFSFSVRSLNAGSGLMRSNRGLIRAFAFPRAALPLGAIIRETLSTIPVILTGLVLIMIVPPHAYPNRLWLLLPAVLALQMLFNFGLMLIVARLTDLIPDVGGLVRVFSRFWMYGSGVLFSIERFVNSPTFMTVMQFNPLYHVLEIARAIVIDATVPVASSWLILAAYAVGFSVFGFFYFWRGEVNYGRE